MNLESLSFADLVAVNDLVEKRYMAARKAFSSIAFMGTKCFNEDDHRKEQELKDDLKANLAAVQLEIQRRLNALFP